MKAIFPLVLALTGIAISVFNIVYYYRIRRIIKTDASLLLVLFPVVTGASSAFSAALWFLEFYPYGSKTVFADVFMCSWYNILLLLLIGISVYQAALILWPPRWFTTIQGKLYTARKRRHFSDQEQKE